MAIKFQALFLIPDFGRGPAMEGTDWESASSGVWLRREEKEEKKEERLLVSRTREEEEEKSKRRGGDEVGGVVMRREGSRQRREEDQRRRLSGPTRLKEGGGGSSHNGEQGIRRGQVEARRGVEAKIPSSERGLLAGPVARLAPSRPNNPRPTSRVIEIKGRPMEHHQLQQGGVQHTHQQHAHQQAELQQGHFASADSGISSLNTSTTGSRKSARHTMIH